MTRKYLNLEELAELRRVLVKYREKDVRNVLLLELLLASGGRANEVLSLTPRDLSLGNRTIYFKNAKNSDDREIPLDEGLFARLHEFASNTPATERIFKIRYNQLRNIWTLYRPVPMKLHSLRHSFAIELYRKSLNIRLVQKALGHRDIQTTMIYQDYQYSIDEIRRAMFD